MRYHQPKGEINDWDEIRVPFDPNLRDPSDLVDQPVCRYAPASEPWIQEEYSCDASGGVRVMIRDTVSAHANEYRLRCWSKNRKRANRN